MCTLMYEDDNKWNEISSEICLGLWCSQTRRQRWHRDDDDEDEDDNHDDQANDDGDDDDDDDSKNQENESASDIFLGVSSLSMKFSIKNK